MKAEQVFWMNGIEAIASKVIWHRFGVNKYEMNMLCALQTVLSLKGRRAIGYTHLFDWLGYSFKTRRKCRGYVIGLINKGLVHRLNYKMQPNKPGNSLAISEYGGKILMFYYAEVDKLEKQRPAKYQTLEETVVTLENMKEVLPRYILVKAGRD